MVRVLVLSRVRVVLAATATDDDDADERRRVVERSKVMMDGWTVFYGLFSMFVVS